MGNKCYLDRKQGFPFNPNYEDAQSVILGLRKQFK